MNGRYFTWDAVTKNRKIGVFEKKTPRRAAPPPPASRRR
jgi:hypothetical protein